MKVLASITSLRENCDSEESSSVQSCCANTTHVKQPARLVSPGCARVDETVFRKHCLCSPNWAEKLVELGQSRASRSEHDQVLIEWPTSWQILKSKLSIVGETGVGVETFKMKISETLRSKNF